MDLHYLKIFHASASRLSISRAAEELHLSQPAVSIQIKRLEEVLRLKLFDRIGRKIYLTQNGEILYKYTTKIFDLVMEAEAQIYKLNGTIWGSVQVGATNTPGIYIMPRVLGKFKKQYPDVVANLRVSNGHEIEEMLYQNRIDFAVMSGEPVRVWKGALHVEKIYTDQAALIVSPEHRLAKKKETRIDELAGEVYITQARDSALFRLLEGILSEIGMPLDISMSLGSTDAIKQAVTYNLGISFLPKITVKLDLKLGLLKEVTLNKKKWKYEYYLVYRKDKKLMPAVEKLMELCKEEADNMEKSDSAPIAGVIKA
ncbi:MAG: LysR family transcriptional regulator [Deltaproteobacteria bacterium]